MLRLEFPAGIWAKGEEGCMSRIISIHEYELKPGVDIQQFEQAIHDAEARGLFQLPGLVAHHVVKGIKGARRQAYAAIWIYNSRAAWERLWGTPDQPRSRHEYPANWQIWETEILAPWLDRHSDTIRFTSYEEL
jgi:hypothetical protein